MLGKNSYPIGVQSSKSAKCRKAAVGGKKRKKKRFEAVERGYHDKVNSSFSLSVLSKSSQKSYFLTVKAFSQKTCSEAI